MASSTLIPITLITQFMASSTLIPITLISLLAAASAAASTLDVASSPALHNHDLLIAVLDMQRASFFSFIMLIKMVQDQLPSNATFLIPSDRALSRIFVPEDQVLQFVLRHSIPTPLLFDDLKHLPTGTLLPTSQSGYMARVSNCGRKRFYLNNARLVLPNACTAGSSFRCHGILGVMREVDTPVDCNAAAPPSPQTKPAEPAPPPVVPPQPLPSNPAAAPAPRHVEAMSPSPAASDHDGPAKASSSAVSFSMIYAALILLLVVYVNGERSITLYL